MVGLMTITQYGCLTQFLIMANMANEWVQLWCNWKPQTADLLKIVSHDKPCICVGVHDFES
jgi:hypothetical protein